MTPHDLNPRTFQPAEQGLSSTTMVKEEPDSPTASPDDLPEWPDTAFARDRMVEAIAMLEVAATALNAPSLTAADLQAARHANHALGLAVGRQEPGHLVRLIDDFHQALYARCANSRMVTVLGEELTVLRAVYGDPVRLSPQRLRRIVKEHTDIVDLLEADPESPALTQLLRTHRGNTCYL